MDVIASNFLHFHGLDYVLFECFCLFYEKEFIYMIII
jgi:hypothetical protein